MPEQPLWKAYEEQIYTYLKAGVAADAVVTFDSVGSQRLPGRYSKIERQIDVLVRGSFAGLPGEQLMVVDCKHMNRRLDVGDVDAFVGFVEDIGTELGLLVTTEGFSEAAKSRAQGARGIQLDVVALDELAKWRPRNPTVSMSSGSSTAVFSFRDEDRRLHTEIVDRSLAERFIREERGGEST